MSNEVPVCIFYWTFTSNMCKYKLPNLDPGPKPPTPQNCEVLSSTYKIIPPSPPRTEPSPIPCFGVFPINNYKNISDPDGCSECVGFKGYPDQWPPPSDGDPRYGPSNTTWSSTGEEAPGLAFRYIVEWTRIIRCKNKSGRWGQPYTSKTTVSYNERWIIQNGISTTTGYTVVDCGKSLPPLPPPPPSY